MDIKDLVSAEINVGRGGKVQVTDVVAFVILKYMPGKDRAWTCENIRPK